ncbi:MAG: NAD(P)-dependent alcohol dehydrogenase [Thiohalomonadales bacterium]
MKAILCDQYGPPDCLQLKEVEKPNPGANEVLIKIYATAINASDLELLTGKPLYARIYGLFEPKNKILGSDIAGQVESVGRNISRFQSGDEVFGDIFDSFGGFAEYVCVPEDKLHFKPASLTYPQAAAIPQAATIALQGLRDKGIVQAGDQVLINGGGGGSGSFAIQIAKMYGAQVTAVDNTEKLAMMQSAGADHVIDYTEENFIKSGHCYDLILDLAAHYSIFEYQRILKRGGSYVMVGGSMRCMLQLLLFGKWIHISNKKRMGFLALKNNKDLDFIMALIEAQKIKIIIDKCYPLSETAAALRYVEEGHAKGKVVITQDLPHR